MAGEVEALFIDFRDGGNAFSYLRHGWSFPEADGIWGIDAESGLLLPPIVADRDLMLEIYLRPMLAMPDLPHQRLAIAVNGHQVYSGLLVQNEPALLVFPVSKSFLKGASDNVVTLWHPDAAAPSAYVATSDGRVLGIFVSTLLLRYSVDNVAGASDGTLVQRTVNAVDNRRLILFYWDDVPHEIGSVLETFPPFESSVELRFVPNTVPWDVAVELLSNHDRSRLFALWEEVRPIPGGTAPARRTRLSHQHVRIPRPVLSSLWPLRCHDPRLVAEPPDYPRGRYPHTDRAGVALIPEAGLPDDVLYDRYRETAREMTPDLDAKLASDIAAWRRLDQCADIKIADFLVSRLRSTRLFFTPDVPGPALLVYIVEHLLASLLPALPISPSALFEQFRYYIHGYQGPFLDQAPVNPDVADRLALSYCGPSFNYRCGRMKYGFREHILDYIRWVPRFS